MHRLTWPFVLLAGCGNVSPKPPASQPIPADALRSPASQPTSQPTSRPTSQPTSQPAHGHPTAPHADAPDAQGHHRFTDAERWSKRFDAPERDGWQKPDAVIERLKLSPEMRVADVGAGTGYFTVRFARALPEGRVIGADIEPNMVDFMAVRAAEAGLTNMIAIEVPATGPRLPEPVDLIFVCNTWHHVQDRGAWLATAARQLKPGGRLAIVDYTPGVDSPGPPQAMRVPADQVIAELKAAGYTLAQRDEGFLPRQYLLIFNAPTTPPQRAPGDGPGTPG